MILYQRNLKNSRISKSSQSRAILAFINADQIDKSLCDEVTQALKRDIDCITPLRSRDVAENRAFFEEAVAICEHLLIIYGKVQPQWVLRQIGEIRKIIGREKQQIIYDGPPEKKPDLPFAFSDLHVIVCRQGICERCEPQIRNLMNISSHGGTV